MELTVSNFRCYTNEVAFKCNVGLNLLAGTSGSGKSTLLDAIMWCLYGSHHSPGTKTRVCVALDRIIITRSGQPRLLKVRIYEENTWRSVDDGQSYINIYFGTMALWLASAYLRQMSHSPFIDAKSSQKMDLVRELTFGDLDSRPDTYLQRIDDKLITHKRCTQDKIAQYNAELQLHRRTADPDIIAQWGGRHINTTVLKNLDKKIAQVSAATQEASVEYTRNHERYLQYMQLQEQLACLTYVDTNVLSERLNTVQANLNQIHINQRIREINILRDNLEVTPTHLTEYPNVLKYLHIPYDQVCRELKQYEASIAWVNQWRESQKHNEMVKAVELQYNRDVQINTELKAQYEFSLAQYNQYLSQVNQIHVYERQREQLQARINQLCVTFTTIAEARDTIAVLKLKLRELTCPHCGIGLVYTHDQLCIGTTTREDHELLQTRIDSLTERVRLEEALNDIPVITIVAEPPRPAPPLYVSVTPPPSRRQLPVSPKLDVDPSTFDVAAAQAHIDSLMKIPPHHRKIYQRIPQYYQYTHELSTLTYVEVDVDCSHHDINVLQDTITRASHSNLKITWLTEQCSKVSCTPPSKVRLDEVSAELDELTQRRDIGRKVLAWKQEHALLDRQCNSIVEYTETETRLNKLREIVITVSTHQMEATINTLNVTIRQIVQQLFDDEISVSISSHKQIKTTGESKVQVNLQVTYRGIPYTTPSQMSGGEQDRISIALTFALAALNPSPLLLLDECMASLDANLRERCIKVVRTHCSHKIILHVCHEIVQGYHDAVIQL